MPPSEFTSDATTCEAIQRDSTRKRMQGDTWGEAFRRKEVSRSGTEEEGLAAGEVLGRRVLNVKVRDTTERIACWHGSPGSTWDYWIVELS